MQAYEVPQERWAFKLVPQLVGKAQQAYAALSPDDVKDYAILKKAILLRYDINELEESYRQRFRVASRKDCVIRVVGVETSSSPNIFLG